MAIYSYCTECYSTNIDFSIFIDSNVNESFIIADSCEELSENSDFSIIDLLPESIIIEAAETNSMSMAQASAFYKRVMNTCKNNAESKSQIEECITVLKKCRDDMIKAKEKANKDVLDGGRIRYAINSVIPIDNVLRIVKKNDWEVIGIDKNKKDSNIASDVAVTVIKSGKESIKGYKNTDKIVNTTKAIVKGTKKVGKYLDAVEIVGDVVLRLATYTEMLDKNIESTTNAIEFLERKKKKL